LVCISKAITSAKYIKICGQYRNWSKLLFWKSLLECRFKQIKLLLTGKRCGDFINTLFIVYPIVISVHITHVTLTNIVLMLTIPKRKSWSPYYFLFKEHRKFHLIYLITEVTSVQKCTNDVITMANKINKLLTNGYWFIYCVLPLIIILYNIMQIIVFNN
jgi:hypothetical protein